MAEQSNNDKKQETELTYYLEDRPGMLNGSVAAAGHLAAIVASILTAPLLICGVLNLGATETRYILSASLIVSGIATFIQVYRIGYLGCGMIAVQGTSFAFVGPLAYLAPLYVNDISATLFLGKILGTCAVCGFVIMIASFFLDKLRAVITPTVAGTAIMLLGMTLLQSALKNFSFALEGADTPMFFIVGSEAAVTLLTIAVLSRLKKSLVRVACIPLGLAAGCFTALVFGDLNLSLNDPRESIFVITPMNFSLGFDFLLLLLLLPIFLVSLTESIGDITATSMVSGEPISGPRYLERLQGGIRADGFNTVLASVFGTFPNTTFSQNNAVIKITGIASRQVGIILAIMLVALGSMPQISHLFTLIPAGVLNSATGFLFSLIAYTGLQIILQNNHGKSIDVLLISCFSAFALSGLINYVPLLSDSLPQYASIVLGFPVATGTCLAILLDYKLRPQKPSQ